MTNSQHLTEWLKARETDFLTVVEICANVIASGETSSLTSHRLCCGFHVLRRAHIFSLFLHLTVLLDKGCTFLALLNLSFLLKRQL